MKVETQPFEDHQVKLTVEVEPDRLEEAKQRAGRRLAKQVKIPGFRPGKAPYAMVLRHLGEAAILEEATELLVNDIYPEALDQAGVEPYGPGTLDSITSMDPPTFEFVVPLKAEVELGDYRSLRFPYEPKEITDEDVERVVSELRDRQAVLEHVDRPAQEGDMVYTRLSGERKQVEEGEDPTLIKDRSLPVVIETEETTRDEEWPFPGFSRQLIGMSAGEEKTITHTYSESSEFESLRGVEAEFHVSVEEVKSRTLPELDDEFAQSVGEYNDLEDLRTKVRSDLEKHSRETYNEDYDQMVLEELSNQSEVRYPPQMLEQEIDNVIEQLKQRLAQQNLDLDLYLKTREMDMEALREESRPVAETRLKKTLVLLHLSDAENIKVDPEELQAETTRTLEVMSRVLSEKDARRLSDRSVVSNLVGNIMMDMMTNRTLEHLRAIASGQAEKEAEAPAESETGTSAEQETGTTAEVESQPAAELETSPSEDAEVGPAPENGLELPQAEEPAGEGEEPQGEETSQEK